VVEELRNNSHCKEYLPVMGLWELREAVADYQRRTRGLPCSADDVLIGPGSKELMFLLQLVYYGELLIPKPGWVSYGPQAQIVGRPVRWLPTSAARGWKLAAEDLERLCRRDADRPRILVLCSEAR
jgi:aspartate aminotransferase